MRSFFLGLAAAAGLAWPAGAQLQPEQAEAKILAACKAEAGTDPEACTCYVAALRDVLPAETYEVMMTLAAAGMTGDQALMGALIEEEDLDPETLEAMLLEMQAAVAAAEKRCTG